MSDKPSFSEKVAERLIAQLKTGTAPWQRPWDGDAPGFIPYNPTTGKRYKGINAIWLMSQNREDARWLTYNQALAEGAQVKGGEKGSVIQYWKFTDDIIKRDDHGNPIKDQSGETLKDTIKLERPKVFHAVVFNAEQIDGLPPAQVLERNWDPIDRAEAIVKASGAKIHYVAGNKAFYSPAQDIIQLPLREQFRSADNFYATALHELGHWTGHESRLNRDLQHPFGSVAYAKEELRAEIASMILGNELGIGHDVGQHVAYVASWIQLLEDDQLELFRAAADAEKIQSFVLALEQTQTQELNREAVMSTPQQESIDQTKFVSSVASTPYRPSPTDRFYINVPFKEKNEAKALGAKWDRQADAWFVPEGIDQHLFDRWKPVMPGEVRNLSEASVQGPSQKSDPDHRTYLAIPYVERQQAKARGAKWDKAAKSWYTTESDLSSFTRWLPENVAHSQMPAVSPINEFADVLRSVNCLVIGEHPIMDGEKHRIAVDGDKRSEKSGFYVGHTDGHPAGYVINNRTGAEIRWKSKGYTLSEQEKAQLKAEVAAKLQARLEAQLLSQQQTAKALKNLWDVSPPAPDDHPYLIKKHVSGKGLRRVPTTTADLPSDSPILIGTDKQESARLHQENETNPSVLIFTAGDLLVPAQDPVGHLWSLQAIDASGLKRFAKGGRKEGCFYLEGGWDALQSAPALVVAEGMATGKTLSETLNFPVIAAFDSGNLLQVVTLLHQQFPDKPFIVAGDDDRQLEIKQGINVGRKKAQAAAEAVSGTAIFPIFAKEETSLTDFNDLATKSVYGKDGLDRQVKTVIAMEIEKHSAPLEQQLEQKQDIQHRQKISRVMR